jgi:hypothetical protein
MPRRQKRVSLGTGILAVALGACSDGHWQSDLRPDTSLRTVEIVSASSLVVPSGRFIMVVFNAGHPGRFGPHLKRDENLVRARLLLRLADQDGEQNCSFEAACRALYLEESDIHSGLIPLRMRGSVTLERGWRGRHLSAHLRIIPKDEDDLSQRYVGSGGSFLDLKLEGIRVRDGPHHDGDRGFVLPALRAPLPASLAQGHRHGVPDPGCARPLRAHGRQRLGSDARDPATRGAPRCVLPRVPLDKVRVRRGALCCRPYPDPDPAAKPSQRVRSEAGEGRR